MANCRLYLARRKMSVSLEPPVLIHLERGLDSVTD
jgi:hypothetical protein